MKPLLLIFQILLLALLISPVQAQESDCTCQQDVDFLNSQLKKTPAYKQNKKAYQQVYQTQLAAVKEITGAYPCLVLLNRMLLPLNDNHMKVYGVDNGFTDAVVEDQQAMEAFKKSEAYSLFTKPKLDLDSLEQVLSKKPFDEPEGIYFRSGFATLAVAFNKNTQVYQAIILKSESPSWERGELIYTLIPYGNGYLRGIGGNSKTKRLVAFTERINEGIFLTLGFQKDPSQLNFSSEIHPDTNYFRKELTSDITYIKVGSFNSFYPTLSDAEAFYASLKSSLSKKQLVVDLRDNGGGGDRNSGILFDILKAYSQTKRIYLITNHRTASNAEQFTQKLKSLGNCMTLGDRTFGTASYEVKNSASALPCGKFKVILTAKAHKPYLPLESQGIAPDVYLAYDRDWLEQVLEYIAKNN
jgi:hypothetical protein